jgi:DNA-binding CsgD family transcriptional regulator
LPVEVSGLLERDEVIASVERLVEDVSAGRSGTLFLSGEAGLGKTSVVDLACELASDRGLAIGRARGHPLETTLPFGLLAQALDGVGGHGLLGEDEPSATAGVRAARFFGVLRWLQERSGRGVLLALDDMHWSDADSLALISFIGRRAGSLALGLIGCMRPWPPEAARTAAGLAEEARGAIRQLAPLSVAASGELLAQQIGRAVPPEVTRRAAELCAGNPLLLAQLAVAIEHGEDLPAASGQARAAFGQGVLLARFAGVPPAGLRYAQAASVLGTSFLPDVAAELAGLTGGEVEVALESVGRTGLIVQRPGAEAEFVHPLFRQALYDDLAGPIRSRMHSRAFNLLHDRGRDGRAAEHAVLAGLIGDPAAVAVLGNAGHAARRAGALAAAVTRFDEAVALAGERISRDLLLARAEALLAAGQADRAIGAYRALLGEAGRTDADRVEPLWMLGRALVMAGEHDEAAAVFGSAADLAAVSDPVTAAEILHNATFCRMRASGPALALPVAARAVELAGPLGGALAVRAAADWGQIAVTTGDPDGMAAAEPAAPWRSLPPVADAKRGSAERGPVERGLAERGLAERGGWGSINSFGYCARLVERFAEADRAFGMARQGADQAGSAEAIATLAVAHGYTLARMGRLDEALAAINVALPLAELVPQVEAYAAVGSAYLSLYLGRLDESARWCERVEEVATRRGERLAMLFLWDVRGHRRLREGAAADACDLYDRLEAEIFAMGIGEPCLPPWAGHAIAARIAGGRAADAERLLGWLELAASRLPCKFPRIAASTARAQLAELAGDDAQAEHQYRTSLALHEDAQLPVDRAETLLDFGAFLRRSGRRAEARAVLAESAEVATAAGALWLAGLAAAELRSAGGRRRTRDPTKLSGREQRVAELTAAGLTNAEIARQLYVTASTVETHLEHIYAKLGIHSRYELIAMTADARLKDVPVGDDPARRLCIRVLSYRGSSRRRAA